MKNKEKAETKELNTANYVHVDGDMHFDKPVLTTTYSSTGYEVKHMQTSEFKKEPKTINYKPAGKYILLKTKDKTDSGILLPSNLKSNSLALEVVCVGNKVEDTKVGDMIVFDGGAFAWTIDGENYYQIHESGIAGYVLHGADITQTSQDKLLESKEPTEHYNG